MAVPHYNEILPVEVRYPTVDLNTEAVWASRRAGNVETGFYDTHAPQRFGFWDIALHDKSILAQEEIPGNVFTAMENLPFATRADQMFRRSLEKHGITADMHGSRYVSLAAAKVMREAYYGESEKSRQKTLNGFEWLVGLHPAQDVGDIDYKLTWEQPGYAADKWADKWAESNPELYMKWAQDEDMPVDMVSILKGAKSVPEFKYMLNRQEMLFIARANTRRWKGEVGWRQEAASLLTSGLGNWTLNDPLFVPSLMVPFGGPLLGAAKGAPAAATAARLALRPVVGGRWAWRGGKVTSKLYMAPRNLQMAAATKLSHRGAVAVELGAWVGSVDAIYQNQAMKHSEINFAGNEDYVRKFDWLELGMATTIGAGLGTMIGGKYAKEVARRSIRKAWAEQMNGGDWHPIAHSWDFVNAGTRLDADSIVVKRLSLQLLGDNDHHIVARYMDPNLMLELGLVPNDIRVVLQRLSTASGGKPLKTGIVLNAVNDLFTEAAHSRGSSEVAEAGLKTMAERQAWAIAFGRAGMELADDAPTAKVVELAKTKHMPVVLQEAEDRVTRMVKKFKDNDIEVVGMHANEIGDLLAGKLPQTHHAVEEGLTSEPFKLIFRVGQAKPIAIVVDVEHLGKGWRATKDIDEEVKTLLLRAVEDAKTPASKKKIARAMGEMVGALIGDDPKRVSQARRELSKFGVGQRLIEMETELRRMANLRKAGIDNNPAQMSGAEMLKKLRAAGKKGGFDVIEGSPGKGGKLILKGKGAAGFYGKFGSPGVKKGEIEYLRRELKDLDEIANYRMFSTHEDAYAEKVMARLSHLTGEPHHLEGFAKRAGARYADGRMTKPLKMKGQSVISRLIAKIQKEEDAVAAATDPKTKRNANARLARAQKGLREKALSEPGLERVAPETMAQKLEKLALDKDPRINSPAGRTAIVEELADSVDVNGAMILEDHRFMGKMLTGWGLGKLSRWMALGNTGQEEGIRSISGLLRHVSAEFDNTKTLTDDLRPGSKRAHTTATSIKREVERRMGLLLSDYSELHRKGKFGVGGTNAYHAKRTEFDKAIIKAIHGIASDDPDVQGFVKLWKFVKEDIEKIMQERGLIEKGSTVEWFPKRFAIGRVMANHTKVERALKDSLWNHWLDVDEVHLRTLAKHGRVVSKWSKDHEAWIYITPDGEKFFQGNMTRSNLKKFGITENEYVKMLGETPPGAARSAIDDDAIDFVAGLTDANRKVQLPGTHMAARSRGKARAQFERSLPDRVLEDPQLDEFMDWRFLDLAHDFLNSTGFEVLNNQRHAARWGVRGLTMRETFDAMENKTAKWVKDLSDQDIEKIGMNRDEIGRKMKKGVWVMRKQLDIMEGRQPVLREEVGGFYEYLSQATESVAGWLWGSGIGHSILGTEGLGGFFGHMTRPLSDLIRRIFYALKFGRMMTTDTAGRMRFLKSFGIAARQFKQMSMERLTGVNGNSGYQFGVMNRMIAPWREAGNIMTGKSGAVSGIPITGKAKLGSIAAVRAAMSTSFQVGGLDFWTGFVRLMHIQGMADQMGHFWKAAEKTAKLMLENKDYLNGIEDIARARALKAGKSPAAANAAAHKALHSAWRGITRKGGFGGNDWHVAERLARFGFFDDGGEMLMILRRAGEETGALQDGGFHRTVDFPKIAEWMGGTNEERVKFGKALAQMTDMVEQTVHKRVSEGNIYQQLLTSDARNPMGRIMNVMGTWARSAYDNIVVEGAQMPTLPYLMMIGTFLLGETMNRTTRDLYRGRSMDDIIQDFEDDPDNWIAQRLFSLPVAGQWTPLFREVGDALTSDQKHRTQVFQSPGIGAIDNFVGAIGAVTSRVSPLTDTRDLDTNALKTLPRLIPGYRSAWWIGMAGGVNAAGGPNIGQVIEGKRKNPRARFDFNQGDGNMRSVPPANPEEFEATFYPDFSQVPDYTKPFED